MDDFEGLRSAIAERRVQWRRHALERMMERGFTRSDVFRAVESGKIIESDLHRKPLPTFLWLAKGYGQTIHVVTSWDRSIQAAYIITVYEPDDRHFERDRRTRRTI